MMLRLYRAQRRRIARQERKERDAETRQRLRIVLLLDEEHTPTQIHQSTGAARSTVYRVAGRFIEAGEDGLRDRRPEVAPVKVTEGYVEGLEALVYKNPQDLGWQRPNWTCELLARQMAEDTGIELHQSHVNRLLLEMGIRWGRPRAGPLRYTSKAAKSRKVNRLKRKLAALGDDEVVLYADEVDIHLNPKIGSCWMPRGEQFEVETPGKNEKRYIFGGLNPKTGHVVWISAYRKNSYMYIQWLKEVKRVYRRYRRIHLVLDNYIIHKSKMTLSAIAKMGGKIVQHFLPPYSPEHNPIERLWGELHANVTRNHRRKSMKVLMMDVENFLREAIPYPGSRPSLARAA